MTRSEKFFLNLCREMYLNPEISTQGSKYSSLFSMLLKKEEEATEKEKNKAIVKNSTNFNNIDNSPSNSRSSSLVENPLQPRGEILEPFSDDENPHSTSNQSIELAIFRTNFDV